MNMLKNFFQKTQLKKGLLSLNMIWIMTFYAGALRAQFQVSTIPSLKNFLIEKGTGIACCSCPDKTHKCDSIIKSYPKGRGHLMVYHFGPDARPQAGKLNKDYRTQFGDSILTPVWPFYLNMMVNRKDRGAPYGSTFVFGTTDQVSPECALVAAELAPVNLAMSSSYNSTSREIIVQVKAYYTENSATSKNYLQIALTEDSMVGPQCVHSPPFIYDYAHMDIFRANINGPLGVPIVSTTAGSSFNGTYSYILPAKFGTGVDQSAWISPNPKFLKLVAFITEDINGFNSKFGKIQNVISAPLGSTIGSGVEKISQSIEVNIFPNPSSEKIQISSVKPIKSYELLDISGRSIYTSSEINSPQAETNFSLIPVGLYLLKVYVDDVILVKKVLIEH